MSAAICPEIRVSESFSPRPDSYLPKIVAIGASSGGVKALQEFFEALPPEPNAAFVVIVHLDPNADSGLAKFLGLHTTMPVVQVSTSVPLVNNSVYVIAPDTELILVDHMISARQQPELRSNRAPIDHFFRSLASQHVDGSSFAVILTGAGNDGTTGVKAIKADGGIVLVQHPAEAEFNSMPRSAIAADVADFVLPIRQLVTRLVDLLKQDNTTILDEHRGSEDEILRRILAHVRMRVGHDFSLYKRATIQRRIARRMQLTQHTSLSAYGQYVRDQPEEADALFADFLISVTSFFRDPQTFEILARDVIPQIFDGRVNGGSIRVWVPGCATGEEAYSIAMLLLEEATRREIWPDIMVFGSDLDAHAITFAREGRYPPTIESDVSETRLKRFFQRDEEDYRVRRELRDMVVFTSHSLLSDPPFSRLDMISCRNLMIYLDRELQQQVLRTFHYALNSGGVLLLGASEAADQPAGLFHQVDRDARIYLSASNQMQRVFPTLPSWYKSSEAPTVRRPHSSRASLSDAALHRLVLEHSAPPSMLVDRNHRVVHLSETAGLFLQHSGGPISLDASDMVRDEMRFDLRAGLNRALESNEETLSVLLVVMMENVRHRVYLQVKPVLHGDDQARHALVMFIAGKALPDETGPGAPEQSHQDVEVIGHLKQDLNQALNRLRETREDSDVANEELRATNEELLSVNEEYRSTSEELETSKEELQSINEELLTVNAELKLKLESISRAHNDLKNLLAATDFGTLFLDASLRIQRFTPKVSKLFNITSGDEGRPVTDFTHHLKYRQFADQARAVLENMVDVEEEVQGQNGHWYLVRIRPYRTMDDKIEGVVATFVDITERKRIEDALRRSEQHALQETRLVELSRSPIFVWDIETGILKWNRGSEDLYGYTRQEAIGRRKEVLLQTKVPGSSFQEMRDKLLEHKQWRGRLEHRTKSGEILTVESVIELLKVGDRNWVLESTRDVTAELKWERRRQLLLSELSHRVSNTLTVVQSLARQTFRTTPSPEAFIEAFEGRLRALARSHTLLVGAKWEGADLVSLIQSQLSAYIETDSNRLQFNGPPVKLPAEIATPLGLVLHELGTNAVKFGAFSELSGKVDLTWHLTGEKDPTLTLIWQESGGPLVAVPQHMGFGGTVIEHSMSGATVTREFAPAGVKCTMSIVVPDEEEFAYAH